MKKPIAKSVEEVNIYLEGLALRIPDTSTDNAVARFDGTGGALQTSGVTISDTNVVGGLGAPTASTDAATKGYVDDRLPAGALAAFAGSSAPTGWLLCYGQAVSRTTYADLFAVIGTTYGTGDGSTTFNLPDLRGRTVAGLDNMGGTDAGRLDWANTLGTPGGAQKHTLSLAEIPSHNHNNITGVNNQDHWHGQIQATVASGGGMVVGVAANGSGSAANGITTGASGTHNHNIAAEGGGGAHNNMQPTILLNWIIRT